MHVHARGRVLFILLTQTYAHHYVTIHTHVATVPPAHQQPLFQRSKDRISYRHQIFRFDLTQVETSNTMAGSVGTGTASTTPSRHSHELELEINEVKLLQSERDKVVQGRSSGRGYLGLVQVLVNNVRQAAVMGVDVSGGADVSKNANARP